MYLPDHELDQAIRDGRLIFDPPPTAIDPTSIDLHLDRIAEAKIWDLSALIAHNAVTGTKRPEVRIGTYTFGQFSGKFLRTPPDVGQGPDSLVHKRANEVVVKPTGFLLWQTKEKVGTPDNAGLICFVNTKSTKARAGVMVHCAAPTIHATWSGNITLEIVNLGPFDIVLTEDDVIAQLTVAQITSAPTRKMAETSSTHSQQGVDGKAVK